MKMYATLTALAKDSWIFVWIAVSVIASQVVLLANASVGVYITALALISLVGLGLWSDKARHVAISAAIIPAATMISLTVPQNSVFSQTVVFYDSLLILGLVYRFIFTLDFPLERTKLNFKGYAMAIPFVMILGEVLGVIGYLLLKHHYTFDHSDMPLIAAAVVVFAIAEETVFRGLIQQRASLVMNPKLAIFLPVVLYTAMSVGHCDIHCTQGCNT